MSIDSAISIAWDVLKCVFIPIKRQFGYVMSSKRYAQDLQKEVGKLEYEAERIHNAVEEAKNNLCNIYGQVTEWQASAEKTLKEAEDLLRDFKKASKTCCYGTLPNPNFHYQFSRMAKDKIEGIKQLAQEFSELKDISYSGSAPGNVAASTPARREGKDVVPSIKLRDDGIFESRALITRDIMGALANNSNSVVGVYGMGGVGKSTLLVDAESRIREEKLFDLIAKANVSENPDIKRIQEEIAHALGLSNIKNEVYVSLRAELLHKRLEDEIKQKQVLIILDNLWKGIDLKSVGIPCGHDNKVIGCKLLLTSRNRDVLRREMGCDRDFFLGGLQEEEAKKLFERIVGDKVHHVDFKPMVDEVLHKCAGVPFLILAIAKRFKDSSLSEWKDTLNQIKMSKDKGINEVIKKMLLLNYDGLEDEEAKSLLQLCVVYGVSEPSFENLVRYGVGLGLFGEGSSMEQARNRLSSLIRTLQASSLLLDSGEANGFKIHDLVHEFVTSVTSRDHPLLVLKDEDRLVTELPKDKLRACRAICFPHTNMKELPEKLDCPELQIFLFTNHGSFKVPDSLFSSMRKLTVLNLTGIFFTCSPSLFRFLEKLHTLCLDGCSLEDVAILGKLKGLQILSLKGCGIHRLPKEIAQLAELRLLDLNSCQQLRVIEPGVIGSLIKLEELYVENCFHQWNAVEQTPPINASLIELNNKKNLCTLHVCIPDLSVLPEDLNFEKFTKYRIRIGSLWRLSNAYKGSRTLDLGFIPMENILQNRCLRTILDTSDELFLDWLNGSEQSICELSLEGFPKLKHLHVKNSPSVHYILRQPFLNGFKMLELLFLENLINLQKICCQISSKSFCTLKVVRVECCNKMENLFPLSLVRELLQLEEIRVVNCNLIQEIVEADDDGKVELRNLHVLVLHYLPCKNFFTVGRAPSSSTWDDQVGTRVAFFNGQQVMFPSLETLEIFAMGNIETIWDNQVHFRYLKTLVVSFCHGLSHIFTQTIAGNLVELTKLRINDCRMLTEVIVDEGGEEGHVVAFKKLKYLELDGLIGLRCFSSGGYTLMFPLLEDVIVIGCLNMKSFSKRLLETPKLDRVQVIKREVWFWKENLNITIQTMFEIMATVVAVKKMRLSEFSKLIGKWHGKLIPFVSFWQLESLAVDKCPLFINAMPSKWMLAFYNMRRLQVRDCESLEEIFDLEGLDAANTRVLPRLQYLDLINLPKLKRLWDKDLQRMLCFHSLMELTLYKCSNLRHAFAPSMAQLLPNLYEMGIKECGQMIGVIAEEETQVSARERITFPRLNFINLESLPNLTSLLAGKNNMLECPRLRFLTIAHCPKMRSLTWQPSMENDRGTLFTPQVQFPMLFGIDLSHMDDLSKIWTDSPPDTLTYEYLGKLEVQNCTSLENLFPHWLATSLDGLYELRVESCGLEEIVASGDDTVHSTTAQVLFPKLTSLVLHEMPRLESFCPNFPTLKWPSLQEVRVTHCDKLNMLSFAALVNKWTLKDHEQEAHSSFERDFSNLEGLLLVDKDIRMIQDGKFLDDIFGHPKALTLACFHDEKAVFPPRFVLERFQNLKSLEVFCSSFEDIFFDEGLVDEGKHSVLENLRDLKLSKLHNLKRVWREDYLVSKILQSIQKFEVWDCPCLTTLFPVMTSFHNLTNLVVKNSSGLVHLVTVSAIKNLVHLTHMTIIGCEKMKEVVANDGNEKEKVIFLGNLMCLVLQDLPSLLCFSSATSYSFRFPSLYYIRVEECPKMKIFSKGTVITPKLGDVKLFRYSWEVDTEGDLNTAIQKLSA